MSAVESQGAVDRVASTRRALGTENFASFAVVALGLLGWQSPDVLHFLLDQTERQLAHLADLDQEEAQ